MSQKRRDELPEHDRVRAAVFARDKTTCQASLIPELAHPCFGGLTFGHLRKASQGGEYAEENGTTLCAVANGLCESDADFARRAHEHGLVILRKDVGG